MLIISHRGNLMGSDPALENHPIQIDRNISQYSMNIEIDLRVINGHYWLGHDDPQYKIDSDWLYMRSNFLWIHCKNSEALMTLSCHAYSYALNYFWHDKDDYTLTSKGYVWAYPGKNIPFSGPAIAVMPELNSNDYSRFYGICTDYPERYI